MTDRAQFIRDTMRQSWGTRTRAYAAQADGHQAHTRQLVAMIQPRAGEHVLDVATGPGVVALTAAAAVGPSGQVVATDLTPEWAEVVAERCAAAGLANVSFQTMGAEQLDLPDHSFDVAVCQFGLMFVPDPVRALREMRRVLRPGGRLCVAVWSTLDRVACFGAIQPLLEPYLPQLPPDERLPTPLELGEPGLIEQHVAAAGFEQVAAERHTFDVVYASPAEFWRSRVENAPVHQRAALDTLTAEQRQQLERDVMATLERYRRGEALYFPSEAIYVRAIR